MTIILIIIAIIIIAIFVIKAIIRIVTNIMRYFICGQRDFITGKMHDDEAKTFMKRYCGLTFLSYWLNKRK